MFERVFEIWRWLRENLLYVVMFTVLNGCATLNPTTQSAFVETMTYATNKADCEKQGKDYKCASPMKDCQCVERPVVVAPISSPPSPAPLAVEPSLIPTPLPPSQPSSQSQGTNSLTGLPPGESLNLIVKDNTTTFKVRGLRMFNESPDRDHIFVFIKWMIDGKESNINVDMTNGVTRLISQDFGVPSGGRAFSERQDVNPVDWNPATVYTVTISWGGDKVHMEALNSDGSIFAAWDNVMWRAAGQPVEARVGSAYHPYDMPESLEIGVK